MIRFLQWQIFVLEAQALDLVHIYPFQLNFRWIGLSSIFFWEYANATFFQKSCSNRLFFFFPAKETHIFTTFTCIDNNLFICLSFLPAFSSMQFIYYQKPKLLIGPKLNLLRWYLDWRARNSEVFLAGSTLLRVYSIILFSY